MTKKIPDTYADLIIETAKRHPPVEVESRYDQRGKRWWRTGEFAEGHWSLDNDMLEHLLTRRVWKNFKVFVPGHLLVFKIFKDAALGEGERS